MLFAHEDNQANSGKITSFATWSEITILASCIANQNMAILVTNLRLRFPILKVITKTP